MQYQPLKKTRDLTSEDKSLIIEEFLHEKENSVSAISKRLYITESAVHRIINDYLENNRKSTTTSN